MQDLAPIVLFVYNRPEHTLKALTNLSKNLLADKSDLIIYADGPKMNADTNDLEKIKKVRQIIRKYKWCKTVEIIERPVNIGLAGSIVNGISEILSQRNNIIVLEDDLIVSPGFLSYMNSALRTYEANEQVMHISGYMLPTKMKLPETFFLNVGSCWGWGTWSRAWKTLNLDATRLLSHLNLSGRLDEFTLGGPAPYLYHLKSNVEGSLNTWAIKWHTSIFLQKGFCLHPNKSLVSNIGTDGSGVNSGIDRTYMNQPITDHINVKEQPLTENQLARKAVSDFYGNLTKKKSMVERIRQKFQRHSPTI